MMMFLVGLNTILIFQSGSMLQKSSKKHLKAISIKEKARNLSSTISEKVTKESKKQAYFYGISKRRKYLESRLTQL